MDLEIVLNELSLQTSVADISTARKLMSELIQTLCQATKLGAKRVLRTHSNINNIELAPGYPIARWRNDREVDREEYRFFLTLITKAPFWQDAVEEIKDKFDLSEVRHQGKLAEGIRFALISDSLAISLLSEPICQQVKKRLFELEQYCKTWQTGAFNKNLIPRKTTPESDSRIQQFRQELTIKCPDSKERLFSWHLRMTPGAWRLYFSEELGPGKIIIGYIGLKLK